MGQWDSQSDCKSNKSRHVLGFVLGNNLCHNAEATLQIPQKYIEMGLKMAIYALLGTGQICCRRGSHTPDASLFSQSLSLCFFPSFSYFSLCSLNAWATLSAHAIYRIQPFGHIDAHTYLLLIVDLITSVVTVPWRGSWNLPNVCRHIPRQSTCLAACLPTGCIPRSPWPTNYAKYLLITFCLSPCLSLPLSASRSLSPSRSVYINWLVLLEKGLANAANACKRPQSQPSYEAVLLEFRQSKLLRMRSPSLSFPEELLVGVSSI